MSSSEPSDAVKTASVVQDGDAGGARGQHRGEYRREQRIHQVVEFLVGLLDQGQQLVQASVAQAGVAGQCSGLLGVGVHLLPHRAHDHVVPGRQREQLDGELALGVVEPCAAAAEQFVGGQVRLRGRRGSGAAGPGGHLEAADAFAQRRVGVGRAVPFLGEGAGHRGLDPVGVGGQQAAHPLADGRPASGEFEQGQVVVLQHLPGQFDADQCPHRRRGRFRPGGLDGQLIGSQLGLARGRAGGEGEDLQIAGEQPPPQQAGLLPYVMKEDQPAQDLRRFRGVPAREVAQFVGQDRSQLAAGERGEKRQADLQLTLIGRFGDRGVHLADDHDPGGWLGLGECGQLADLRPQARMLGRAQLDALSRLGLVRHRGTDAEEHGADQRKREDLQDRPESVAVEEGTAQVNAATTTAAMRTTTTTGNSHRTRLGARRRRATDGTVGVLARRPRGRNRLSTSRRRA